MATHIAAKDKLCLLVTSQKFRRVGASSVRVRRALDMIGRLAFRPACHWLPLQCRGLNDTRHLIDAAKTCSCPRFPYE